MKRIFDKQAYILLYALLIIIVFTILAAAMFTRAINENLFVRREVDSLKALYAAEQGLESVFCELLNATSGTRNWHTHRVQAGSYTLVPFVGATTSVTILTNELTQDGYASQLGQPVQFIAKVYSMPLLPDGVNSREKIVLVRGISGAVSRLIAAKISLRSLYEYFIFYPEEGLSFENATYDAQGGKIHTNFDITFAGEANLINIGQLTASGYINYFVSAYRPPLVDENGDLTLATRTDGVVDGTTWAEIYGVNESNWAQGNCSELTDPAECEFGLYDAEKFWYYGDGYLQGDNYKVACSGPGGTYSGSTCARNYGEPDWQIIDPLQDWSSYENPNLLASINDTSIPNRMNATYPWSKYWESDGVLGNYVYNRANGMNYTYPVSGAYTEGSCPSEFCADVSFTNSKFQVDNWRNFIENSPLAGIVMEHNTGAPEAITPITINPNLYKQYASQKGFYIQNTLTAAQNSANYTNPNSTLADNGEGNYKGNYKVTIKGTEFTPNPADGKIYVEIDGQQVPIFEKKGFYNAASTRWNQVVAMDVANVNRAIAEGVIPMPEKNIAYFDWPALIKNAEQSLDGGLAVITEGDGFLMGDINTDPNNFQPTAIISPRIVFLLSDNFNFSEPVPGLVTLPELAHHPDFEVSDPTVDYTWQTEQNAAMANKVLPDPQDPQGHTYNISIIGDFAADLDVLKWSSHLERWRYPGSSVPMPSPQNWEPDWITKNQTITGTILRLPSANFITEYDYGDLDYWYDRRCTSCNPTTSPWGDHCRGCSESSPGYPGCNPQDQQPGCSSAGPVAGNNPGAYTFNYEANYLTGNVPPGDLIGLNYAGWLELTNNEANFTHHCQALQGQ